MINWKTTRLWWIAIFLAAVAFINGCASLKNLGKSDTGYQRELTPEEENSVKEKLIALCKEQKQIYLELSGQVNSSEGGGIVGIEAISVFPGKLRIETKSFFGTGMSSLAYASDKIVFFDVAANTVIVASATRENMAKLFMLPIAPRDLLHILFARPPVENIATAKVLRAHSKDELAIIEERPDGLLVSVVDKDSLLLRRAYLKSKENYLWKVRLDDYSQKGGRLYPTVLKYRQEDPVVTVSLRVKDVDFSADVNDKVFELSPPEGFRLIYLD